MAKNEKIKVIDNYFSSIFIKTLIFYIVYCLIISIYNTIISEINRVYLGTYLFNLFLQNLLEKIIFFFFFYIFVSFSLFFNDSLRIRMADKLFNFIETIHFPTTLLVILAFVYLLSIFFIIPNLNYQLDKIKFKTKLVDDILKNATYYEEVENYKKALKAYEDYMNILKPTSKIKEKIRILKLKIYEQEKNVKEIIIPPSNLRYYIELADYYYEKEDYISSWYYYLYVTEDSPQNAKKAKERINEIKKILTYRNSLQNDPSKDKYLDNILRQIRNLYSDLKKANSYFDEENYIDSYYTFYKITKSFPNLRDAQQGLEKAKNKVLSIYSNYDDLIDCYIYPSNSNFIINYSKELILKAEKLVRYIDVQKMKTIYYFYDLRLIENINNELSNIIYCKYGELKNKYISLMTLALEKENYIFAPVYERLNSYTYNKILSKINKKDDKEQFENYYEIKDGFYKLKTLDEKTINSLSLLYRKYKLIDFISNYSLPFGYDFNLIYNIIYNKDNINNITISKNLYYKNYLKNNNINLGFSYKFFDIQILYNITNVSLFFIISLILIALFYRLKTKEVNSYNIIFIPIGFILALAIEYFFKSFNYFIISILFIYFTFTKALIFVIITHLLLLLFSIIYIVRTK